MTKGTDHRHEAHKTNTDASTLQRSTSRHVLPDTATKTETESVTHASGNQLPLHMPDRQDLRHTGPGTALLHSPVRPSRHPPAVAAVAGSVTSAATAATVAVASDPRPVPAGAIRRVGLVGPAPEPYSPDTTQPSAAGPRSVAVRAGGSQKSTLFLVSADLSALRTSGSGRRAVKGGWWTADGRRWVVDGGLSVVDTGQRTLDGRGWGVTGGRRAVNGERWTVDGGRWTVEDGRWR